MSRPAASAAVVLLAMAFAGAAAAQGKYARRQALRGDVTDTSPKIDRFAFINDAAPGPQRLVLIVDAWPARYARDPRLVPLRIGLSYEGHGKPIPVEPSRFELSWEGAAAPVKALTHAQLVEITDQRLPLAHDLRMLRARAPLPFDRPLADPVFVQFYSDPTLPLKHDTLKLASARRFTTLAYFRVPEGFDLWDSVFELAYVPQDGAPPAVTCRFRIERDAGLQARAMRRARKDIQREERHRE